MVYLSADVCDYRDTSASNLIPPTSTTQLPKSSTKPSHRRARPSIDKTQVSRPYPIFAHDERDLFDVMTPDNFQARARRIPKAAEKKVKINVPKQIESGPQPKFKASADPWSWYTPAPVQSPSTVVLQRSASNATPRTTPSKANVGRANSTKEFRSHGRTNSEVRRDGVEIVKQRVQKILIKHPDCPWFESANEPTTRHAHPTQHRPVRSEPRGSCESDKTAVEDVAPTRGDIKKEEKATPLAKSAQETLRPTVRLVSKPLPDPPAPDSVSSRWTASTGSVYTDGDPFSYDQLLDLFPKPPNDMPNAGCFNDWESYNSLSTPPAFISRPNMSSSSITTIAPTAIPDPPAKPMLKAVPKPKVATVVYQTPRASYSYNQLQDSTIIHDSRAYPQAWMNGSIHTSSIRATDAAPTLRRRSSSFTASQSQNPPRRVADIETPLWPHTRQTPEDIERNERQRLECERKWQIEEKERELHIFEMEFGYNLWCKGKKKYQREVEPNGFELFRPEKEKQRKIGRASCRERVCLAV